MNQQKSVINVPSNNLDIILFNVHNKHIKSQEHSVTPDMLF